MKNYSKIKLKLQKNRNKRKDIFQLKFSWRNIHIEIQIYIRNISKYISSRRVDNNYECSRYFRYSKLFNRLSIVCSKKYIFEQDKSVFKQVRGTAIGTKKAPPYGNIFTDFLEKDILSNSLLKPLVCWNYIDDIFMVWDHGEEDLKMFLDNLNCRHPTINFTVEYYKFYGCCCHEKG